MQKILCLLLTSVLLFASAAGCLSDNSENEAGNGANGAAGMSSSVTGADNDVGIGSIADTGSSAADAADTGTMQEIKVRITVGDETLTATFIDNPASRRLVEKFPLTLPMEDLYSREMYYSFQEELPAPDAGRYGYEIGDIAYWTPGKGLVIFYEQNGEIISGLQMIGRIDSGAEIFKETGDAEVTFELIE